MKPWKLWLESAELDTFKPVVTDLLRRMKIIKRSIPSYYPQSLLSQETIQQARAFIQDYYKLLPIVNNIIGMQHVSPTISGEELSEWWQEVKKYLEQLVADAEKLIVVSDNEESTFYRYQLDMVNATKQLSRKMQAATIQDFNSPVRNYPEDRNSYGIASDMLEEQNGDPYLITILRSIFAGKQKYIFCLRGTQNYEEPYVFESREDNYIYDFGLTSWFKRAWNTNRRFEIIVCVYHNTPPIFIPQANVQFFSTNFPEKPNKENVLQKMKDLCTQLNLGNFKIYEEFLHSIRSGIQQRHEEALAANVNYDWHEETENAMRKAHELTKFFS